MAYRYYNEISSTLSALTFTRKDLEDEENWTLWSSFRLWKKLFSFLSCISSFIFCLITGLESKDLGTLQTEFMYRFSLRDTWLQHIISERGCYGLLGMWPSLLAIPLIPFGDDPQFLSVGVLSVQMKTFREPSTDAVPGAPLIPYASHGLYFQGENRIPLFCVCVFLIDSNLTF